MNPQEYVIKRRKALPGVNAWVFMCAAGDAPNWKWYKHDRYGAEPAKFVGNGRPPKAAIELIAKLAAKDSQHEYKLAPA